MTRNALAEIGKANWPVEVGTDSGAAIGMCSRAGVGKVRHIEVRQLWLQGRVGRGDLEVEKVRGRGTQQML